MVAQSLYDANTLRAEMWLRYRLRQALTPDPWLTERRLAQTPPPGAWRFWLLLAGRGFGKTRAAAEFVRQEVQAGRAARVQLVARTAGDVRDVVVEGPSGILAVCRRAGFVAHYEPSKRRITFVNGATATTFSADEPDALRGPEFDLGWWDEFAAWKSDEAYENADFGLRLTGPRGDRARAVIPTTPKRVKRIRTLAALAQAPPGHPDAGSVVMTGGHTMENRANLDAATLLRLESRYGGTTMGRQELGGELLDDVEGAHWSRVMIEAGRCSPLDVPALRRIVIGIDPQGRAGIGSETGIVAAGIATNQADGLDHGWVLADESGDYSPDGWGRAAVALYHRLNADRIVAEINFGGEMVSQTIRTIDPDVPITMVSASRGKLVRAEPVAALYEQRRVHHVGGYPALEDEMTGFDGTGPSPNRMDAAVWTLTDLLLDGEAASLGRVGSYLAPPPDYDGRGLAGRYT